MEPEIVTINLNDLDIVVKQRMEKNSLSGLFTKTEIREMIHEMNEIFMGGMDDR